MCYNKLAIIITNKSNPMLSLGNIQRVLIQIHADVPNFYTGAGNPLSSFYDYATSILPIESSPEPTFQGY